MNITQAELVKSIEALLDNPGHAPVIAYRVAGRDIERLLTETNISKEEKTYLVRLQMKCNMKELFLHQPSFPGASACKMPSGLGQ